MRTKVHVRGLVVLAALLLTCGGALAQQPKRGGVVTYFNYADPGRLDVHTESPQTVQQANAGIYSSLLQFDPERTSEIIPDLATSYASSQGGTVYSFQLRQGVKWHDGKPFSSADVKVSMDRVLNPKVRSPRCGSLLRPIVAKVEATGEHEVRFTLKYPTVAFVPSIASAWCRIAAKHILERDGDLVHAKSQIGTGPFIFKRYERNSIIEWERNPGYYDSRYPYVDGVKQFIILGGARQLAAAKAGQVMLWDLWPPMTPQQARELKAARGDDVITYEWPQNNLWAIHLATRKPPFDNKELRRAVFLGLDRFELMDKIFEGNGVPCAIMDPVIYGEFALPLKEVYDLPGCRKDKSQDLAEAKRLVAKHYPNGLDIEVAVRSVANYVDRTQVLVAQLARIGIRGTIKTYESAVGFGIFGKGEFTLIGTQDTAMLLPDASGPIAIMFTSDAGRNYSNFKDETVDRMAAAGLREADPAKRRQIYHDLQRYLLTEEHTGSLVVGWINAWYFKDKRLKNFHAAATQYDAGTFMKVWLEP
ncbi:MAG: hypothetical protein HY423_12135 [Candidatus Lambdaproteobacteria bacterium]|nr:hypothetical protein [Candidatus Lambdaproteobacteria bacterium]